VRRLLPPAYSLAKRGKMLGAGGWGILDLVARTLEAPYAARPRNDHEALFGTVGRNGPAYYLQSQKLVLFNAIVSIAVASALIGEGDAATYPVLYAAFLPSLLTIGLAPTTFLMYSWATAVEELKDRDALFSVLRSQREQGFRAKLRTLSRLCDCFELVSDTEGRCFLDMQPPPSWGQLDPNMAGTPMLNLLTVFDLADADQDGSISREECVLLAHNLGYDLNDRSISSFFQFAQGPAVGSCERNQLVFYDFARAVLSLSGSPAPDEMDERSARLFGYFDVDGGGTITVDEMELRLSKLGLDKAGTEKLFVDITGAPQKTISTYEFTAYLRKTGF